MTFYWWSHWFWITLLDNIICIIFVQSSPRQEVSIINSNKSDFKNISALKIYPPNPTLIWPTSTLKRKKLNNSSSLTDFHSKERQLKDGLEGLARREMDRSMQEHKTLQTEMSIFLTQEREDAEKRHEAITYGPLSEFEAENNTSVAELLVSRLQTVPYVQQENRIATILSGSKTSFTLENVNKEDEIIRGENEHRIRKAKILFAEYNHANRFRNFSSELKSMLARSATTSESKYDDTDNNISSEALAIKRSENIVDIRTITVICFTVFGVGSVAIVGIVLYRRRLVNKPQVLSEPDSSVYIDDSTIRDNSDEMYSLDNDSFLNSLEAMTIQNYWTDTVKHTKL